MVTLTRPPFLLIGLMLAGALVTACLDPLFEAGDVIVGDWVACCDRNQSIDTRPAVAGDYVTATSFPSCDCTAGASCLRYQPARGGCRLVTVGGGPGGGTGSLDAGAAGGGGGSGSFDAGLGGVDAGVGSSDAGVAPSDAGTGFGDAGTSFDAGVAQPDAGSGYDAGSGMGGGAGGGGGTETDWQLCCVSGQLDSCACPGPFCGAPTFATCAHGTCSETGHCPQ